MKKSLLFLVMLSLFSVGFSAEKVKVSKSKTYSGEYIRLINTFTYKKNNLIFKDKEYVHKVQDDSELLVGIYNFMRRNYNVSDSDKIGLVVIGKTVGGVLLISDVINYRIPEERLPKY